MDTVSKVKAIHLGEWKLWSQTSAVLQPYLFSRKAKGENPERKSTRLEGFESLGKQLFYEMEYL